MKESIRLALIELGILRASSLTKTISTSKVTGTLDLSALTGANPTTRFLKTERLPAHEANRYRKIILPNFTEERFLSEINNLLTAPPFAPLGFVFDRQVNLVQLMYDCDKLFQTLLKNGIKIYIWRTDGLHQVMISDELKGNYFDMLPLANGRVDWETILKAGETRDEYHVLDALDTATLLVAHNPLRVGVTIETKEGLLSALSQPPSRLNKRVSIQHNLAQFLGEVLENGEALRGLENIEYLAINMAAVIEEKKHRVVRSFIMHCRNLKELSLRHIDFEFFDGPGSLESVRDLFYAGRDINYMLLNHAFPGVRAIRFEENGQCPSNEVSRIFQFCHSFEMREELPLIPMSPYLKSLSIDGETNFDGLSFKNQSKPSLEQLCFFSPQAIYQDLVNATPNLQQLTLTYTGFSTVSPEISVKWHHLEKLIIHMEDPCHEDEPPEEIDARFIQHFSLMPNLRYFVGSGQFLIKEYISPPFVLPCLEKVYFESNPISLKTLLFFLEFAPNLKEFYGSITLGDMPSHLKTRLHSLISNHRSLKTWHSNRAGIRLLEHLKSPKQAITTFEISEKWRCSFSHTRNTASIGFEVDNSRENPHFKVPVILTKNGLPVPFQIVRTDIEVPPQWPCVVTIPSTQPIRKDSLDEIATMDENLYIGEKVCSISKNPTYLESLSMGDRPLEYFVIPNIPLLFEWHEHKGQWAVRLTDKESPEVHNVLFRWKAVHVHVVNDCTPTPQLEEEEMLISLFRQLQFRENSNKSILLREELSPKAQQLKTYSRDKLVIALTHFCKKFGLEPLSSIGPQATPVQILNARIQQQKGVCRHRARIFFHIAEVLEIPCRLVVNDVHVFVEVEKEIGSRRFDTIQLGGGPGSIEPLPPSKIRTALLKEAAEASRCAHNLFLQPAPSISFNHHGIPEDKKRILMILQNSKGSAYYSPLLLTRLGRERCFIVHDLEALKFGIKLSPSGSFMEGIRKEWHYFIEEASRSFRTFYLILEESVIRANKAYYGLLDTGAHVGDVLLPENIKIVVLCSESLLKEQREDFSFGGRFDCMLQFSETPQTEKTILESLLPPLEVDLSRCQRRWSDRLLGFYEIKTTGEHAWHPGLFPTPFWRPIKLINPPEEDLEYRHFVTSVATGRVVIQGKEYRIPNPEQFLQIEKRPISFELPQEVQIFMHEAGPWDVVLTEENASQFIYGRTLDSCTDNFLFVAIGDEDIHDETYFAFIEKAMSFNKTLHFIRPYKETLPSFLSSIPMTPLEDDWTISDAHLVVLTTKAQEVDALASEIDFYSLAISSNDTSVLVDYQKESERYIECMTPVLENLVQGATFVFYGSISMTLASQLAGLWAREPGVFVNGERVQVKGRVILILPENELPSYFPKSHIISRRPLRETPPLPKVVVESHEQERAKALWMSLKEHRVVCLSGEPKCGKTTTFQTLISTHHVNPFRDVDAWAQSRVVEDRLNVLYTTDRDDLQKIRAIHQNSLIQVGRALYHLSPQHCVLYEGNVDEPMMTLEFRPLPDAAIKAMFDSIHLNAASQDTIFAIYRDIRKSHPLHFGDLLHFKDVFQVLRNHGINYGEAYFVALIHSLIEPLPKKLKEKFLPKLNLPRIITVLQNVQVLFTEKMKTLMGSEGGFILTSSRLKLLQDVELALAAPSQRIIVVEGPTRIGKTTLLRNYLLARQQRGELQFQQYLPDVSLKELWQAANNNMILLLDELNTFDIEKISLIQRLTKENGLRVIATQNSSKTYQNRTILPQESIICFTLEQYSREELILIAKAKGLRDAEIEPLVGLFLEAQSIQGDNITFSQFEQTIKRHQHHLSTAASGDLWSRTVLQVQQPSVFLQMGMSNVPGAHGPTHEKNLDFS